MGNYVDLSDKALRVIIFTLNREFDENDIDIEGNDIFQEEVVEVIDKALEYFNIKDQTIELFTAQMLKSSF